MMRDYCVTPGTIRILESKLGNNWERQLSSVLFAALIGATAARPRGRVGRQPGGSPPINHSLYEIYSFTGHSSEGFKP